MIEPLRCGNGYAKEVAVVNERNKQKVMLAVVPVLVLGAGGVWFFSSGSGGRAKQALKEGPVQRKPRAAAATINSTGSKRKKVMKKWEREKPEVRRKERKQDDGKKIVRKNRKPGREKQVKKKKASPHG